jgi:hypothetical protein
LSKDRLLFGKIFDLSPAVDGRKECLGVKLDKSLGCCNEWHKRPLSIVPSTQKATSYDVKEEWKNKCARRARTAPNLPARAAIPPDNNNDFTLAIESQ